MRATNYTVFCLKVFGKLLSKYKKISLEEKQLPLVRANIPMSYEEFYSTALMNFYGEESMNTHLEKQKRYSIFY